jgi:hypothetical protein
MTGHVTSAKHPQGYPSDCSQASRAGSRWQVQQHEPPFGIAVSSFNVRMSFPADLSAHDRDHLIELAHAFAHVLRAPALLAPTHSFDHSFDDWATAIARQYDMQHPKVYSAVQMLRRMHQVCDELSSASINSFGKALP